MLLRLAMIACVTVPRLYFGSFTLDRENRRLFDGAREVDLGNRYFDALVLLTSNPGELIAKDRFMTEVWAGIPVTDEALTQCIRTLRRALGDRAAAPLFIQTVPKHGYRFIGEVASEPDGGGKTDFPSSHDPMAGRLAGATTVGGGLSGLLGGLTYGMAGTTGGTGPVAAIVLLTVALSVVGASVIGAGLGAARIVRPSNALIFLAGGTCGGLIVGAVGQQLASAGLDAITGVAASETTGMIEGATLGFASASGLLLADRWGRNAMTAIAIGAASGAVVMALLGAAGIRSYAETLAMLETAFPASNVRIVPVLASVGKTGALALEGALFVASIVAANRLAAGNAATKKGGPSQSHPRILRTDEPA